MSRSTMIDLDLKLEDHPHARTVEPPDAIEALAGSLERRRNKHLAFDSIASVPLEAWSSRDLFVERDRVRTILDQAPPDRTADLAALVESRGKVETKVREQALEVASLEGRKRPRRERRKPDVDLLTRQHNLANFEQQAERLDREIAALHASQHRRESHLAAHTADRIELDSIDDVLRDRLRRQTNRIVQEPPSYITKTLDTRPAGRSQDRAWVSAVVEIEQYRFEHGITDGRTAIGPEPTDNSGALDWYRVTESIGDARNVTSQRTRTIVPRAPAVKVPTLDIGI